jgi:hypothetical protein
MKVLIRALIIFAFSDLLCTTASAARHERPPSNPDISWTEAFSGMSNWLDELIADSDTIKKREDRRRVAEEFESLETPLSNLEDHKRELLFELTNPNYDDHRVDFLLRMVEADLRVAQAAVKVAKLHLRRQLQEEGSNVELRLSDALDARKSWVRQVRERIQNHEPIDRVAVHHDGEEALRSLREAEMLLIKLVDRLRRAPSKPIGLSQPSRRVQPDQFRIPDMYLAGQN